MIHSGEGNVKHYTIFIVKLNQGMEKAKQGEVK